MLYKQSLSQLPTCVGLKPTEREQPNPKWCSPSHVLFKLPQTPELGTGPHNCQFPNMLQQLRAGIFMYGSVPASCGFCCIMNV
jgi:hypothetical protein